MAGAKGFYSVLCSWDFLWCIILTFYYALESPFLKWFKKPKNLKGITVLITGCGRGLGKETSNQLAAEGCRLICVDIDLDSAQKTAEEINQTYGSDVAIAFKLDVTDRKAVYDLEKNLRESGRQIDVLLNNAGIVKAAPLLTESDEMIEKILNVNLISQFWMVKAFLPEMIRRNKGHIAAISSMIAFTSTSNTIPYAASKYGVTGFMYTLREELRQMKGCEIKTTVVHPFFLDSSPYNVEHWKVDARIPDLNIRMVAKHVVNGIKYEEPIVSVPSFLYWSMHAFRFMPTKANDLWLDSFYANVKNL